MKRKTIKKTAYRLLAALLVISTLGANMVTLSYADEEAGREEQTICGLTEHTHIEGVCYVEKKELICGIEEGEIHTHGIDCFEAQDQLICEIEACEPHTHDEACMEEVETSLCGMEEAEPHVHSEICYTETKDLICGQDACEPHQHTENCYAQKVNYICGQDEWPAHTHGENCYTTGQELTCGQSEQEAHSHGEGCYSESSSLSCASEEEGHDHGDGCYAPETVLSCTMKTGDGHSHSEACRTEETVLACGLEETEGHAHTEVCYGEPEQELTCGREEPEGHTHTEDCVKTESVLACGKEETEGHVHGEACYEKNNVQVCLHETDVPHTHAEHCYEASIEMSCQLVEHIHTEACYEVLLELAECTLTDENGLVTVTGLLPETATVQARELTEEEINDLPVPVEQLLFAYDITIWVDGVEYQPETPVQVTVLPQTQPEEPIEEVLVQHIEMNGETNEISVTEVESAADMESGEVTFSAESFSIYIGTVVEPTAGILLVPGTGYTFYQDDNLITGRIEWKSGVTLTVRPEFGYQIDAVTVEDENHVSAATVTENSDGTWTITFNAPGEDAKDQTITVTATEKDVITVYLDLAAGAITIDNDTYTGTYYKEVDGELQKMTGTVNYSANKDKTRFHIYQSTGDVSKTNDTFGYVKEDGTLKAPEYDEVTVTVDGETKSWAEYITNNTDALAVYQAWHGTDANRTGSLFADRAPTANGMEIAVKGQDCDVILENVWSTKQPASNTDSTSSLYVSGCSTADTRVTLRLLGDSKLGRLHYTCSSENGSSMTITDADGAGACGNSLVVVGDPEQVVSNSAYQEKVARNTWQSAIGASDSTKTAYGIVIDGGTVYAGSATDWENCSAIGGGGNRMGQVTINGGNVTAVARTTGTAIGGGIGHQSHGGEGLVTINAGNVYAYNYGVRAYQTVKNFGTNDPDALWQARHIPGTAIGGASSILEPGYPGTVTINGGYVYAESLGGSALGGGNSVTKNAGSATVTINGGTVEAKSTGYDRYYEKDGRVYDIHPGAAIGGGTGGLGSSSGDKGNGGTAYVTINGGRVKTGSIGGGGSNSKNGGTIGAAQVTINGGNVSGQIVMAATGKANPTDEEKCKFTMTGGTLHNDYLDDETFFRMTETKEADGVKITTIYPGGAVYMDDPYGKANISGGAIKNCSSTNGGAVYMTDGEFNLSGTGIIQNCMATENGGAIYMGGAGTAKLNITGGSLRNNTAPENGGAIYMTNGTATISGTGAFMSGTETLDSGSLTDNTATNGNGGAIYLGGGTLTMNGGVLENNTAVNGNGGAIGMGGGKLYITGGSVNTNKAPNGSGGGAYIENGTVIMSGGAVDGNTAREGGGLYVSASSDPADVGVKVFCGSVSGNTATEKGGAIAVVGDPAAEKQNITITIGVNEVHEDANTDGAQDEIKHNEDGNKADAGPYSHLTCPQINGNKVSTIGGSGGALYLTGSVQKDSVTRLNLYCLTATGNDVAIPDGENVPDGLSDFMKVEDGKVIISSGTHHTGDINDDGVVDENDDPDGNDGYFSPDGDYKHGDVNIDGSFHVTGGQVDLYGNIDNPSFGNKPITVDVVDGTSDHFVDHRQVNTNTRTVTYVENFLENGVLSGRYTMYHVLVDQAFAIESGMYSHPGYQMVGWYTEKEYPTATGKKYEPGKSVTLPGGYSAEIGTDSLGNLKLYGIWDMFGYTIRFNCNAPTNATVLGSSDPYAQSFTYEETKALTANQFKVKGYAFQGWSMDQSDTVFDPANPKHFTNQKEVGQLTTSDGVTLDFWGIWTVCEHDDAEKIQYSVEQDSDHLNTATLKKTCTACSTTWERTLFASGGTFNGSAYKATLTTTPGWDEDLQIDYAGQSYGGVDYSSTSAPTGAGNYTASVTLPDGTTKATVTYTISKATQPAPPVPSYESAINETQLTLTITKGAPSTKTGLDAQYRLTYQTDNGSYAYIWLDGVGDDTLIPGGADGTVTYQVDLPQTYTWYYLEAYYPETGNYLQSAMVQANEEIQYGGAVLKIVCDPGITCIRKDLGDSRLQLTLEVRPGYHLIGEKFDVQKTTNKNSDQPVLVKQSDGVYVLSNFEEGSTVTVTIGHARKDASITAAIQEKQLFTTTPDDTTASISRDSAFTAYFHVQGYNETDYAYPTLNFGSALPVGTTIIMVDRSSTTNRYYYHNIASATDSIPLTAAEFSTMGGGTAFALGDEMELQFVVDFSRVTNGGPVGNLTVTLSIDAKSGSHAPTVNADVTAALGDPSFTLQTAALTKEEELTAGVLCGYTSGGADSKWDYRHTALVVRSVGNTPLPADTRLKVTQGNDSITRAQNENGEFVIPIDTLKPGEHTMILTLDTRLNPAEAVTYGLQVRWVASDSFADAAPMNGKGLTNPLRIELRKAEDAVPSIRIEAAQLVKNPATSTELKVLPYKVHHENMGGNRLFMSVEIWDQDKGVYSDTGINLGEEGRIFSEENNPMVEQVSMPANMFGSGRMNFRVEDANGKLVTEVYHYFVISTATAQSEEDAGGDDSGASDPTGSGTTENDTTENGTTESGTTEST